MAHNIPNKACAPSDEEQRQGGLGRQVLPSKLFQAPAPRPPSFIKKAGLGAMGLIVSWLCRKWTLLVITVVGGEERKQNNLPVSYKSTSLAAQSTHREPLQGRLLDGGT